MSDQDDKDVNKNPAPEAPETAPSAAETPAPAEKDPVLEALKDEPEETPESPEPETDKPTETPKEEEKPEEEEKPDAEKPEEDKPLTEADKRKTELNTEIRDLVAQRNALRNEVTKANAEVYQPATEEELIEDGMTELEAKVEAMRQNQEVKDYNERVAEAQLTINTESQRVIQDFPIFRQFEPGTETIDPKTGEITGTPNPDFEAELAAEAGALLEANLIRDPNTEKLDAQGNKIPGTGQVIGSNISPYQLYQTLARAAGISTVKGQVKGQADAEEMLANADNPGSAAPVTPKEDPILAILKSNDY